MYTSNVVSRAVTSGFVSLVLVISSVFSAIAAAQSVPNVDLQPPTISFDEVQFGTAGEIQVFTAQIVEDQELASVTLFYRFGGDTDYQRMIMNALPGSAIHSASVRTDADDVKDIEYYIQAEDVSGNRAIKGFVFDPLVRKIQSEPAAVVATSPVSEPSESSGSSRRWLWGLLGLVAIGLVAGASSSGGGGGGQETPTTPIVVTVTPTNN